MCVFNVHFFSQLQFRQLLSVLKLTPIFGTNVITFIFLEITLFYPILLTKIMLFIFFDISFLLRLMTGHFISC